MDGVVTISFVLYYDLFYNELGSDNAYTLLIFVSRGC